MNYFDDPIPDVFCYECEEKEGTINEIKYWFQAILTLSYRKASHLDEEFERELECYLDELALRLGIKLPKTDIQLARKPSPQVKADTMLDIWKSFNQDYLNNITNKNEDLPCTHQVK